MKKIFISLSYIWIMTIALVPLTASQLHKHNLIYMTEDYPPLNFEKEGKIVGLSPDLLRLMWKRMDFDNQAIEMLPWARAYKLVQIKQNHVLMSMVRTKERESLFKWVGPIAESKYVLIKLSKNKIDIDSLEKAKGLRIATVREDATQQILKSLDFDKKNIVKVNRIIQAIKMLYAGKIDLIAYEKRSFFKILEAQQYPSDDFIDAILLSKEYDHYAFHKDTPDSLIQKFQNALDSLEKEHIELVNYYFN